MSWAKIKEGQNKSYILGLYSEITFVIAEEKKCKARSFSHRFNGGFSIIIPINA